MSEINRCHPQTAEFRARRIAEKLIGVGRYRFWLFFLKFNELMKSLFRFESLDESGGESRTAQKKCK